ncbi:MAG: hypothetical protein ABI839_07695 [Verrucomicrobiota bacterium]
MRRVLLLLVIIFVAGALALFLVRHGSAARAAEVATLLPQETALLLHVPDLEKSSADFRSSDLGSLCQEPFLQQLWRKPAGQNDLFGNLREIWRDVPELRVRNAFIAVKNLEGQSFLGGLEFRCTVSTARAITEGWKARMGGSGATRDAIASGRHQIVFIQTERFALAWSLVGDRILFAGKVADLQELLDRADQKESRPNLAGTENFRAATRQMPETSAALIYLQPKLLAASLPRRGQHSRALIPVLEKITAAAIGVAFEGKKVHEVAFALMPLSGDGKVERATLPLASTDTLLYLSALVDLPRMLQSGTIFRKGKLEDLLRTPGLAPESLEAAFGQEASLSLEWPAGARLPAILATLKVRQPDEARKVLALLAGSYAWSATVHHKAVYYHLPLTSLPWGVNPAIAVTNEKLVFGLDAASVDRVIEATPAPPGLVQTPQFHATTQQLPEPQQLFAYLDLGLAYQRFDAMWRPVWQFGAAFLPQQSRNWLDPGKLPPADSIRDLVGPTYVSQTYGNGGSRLESIGSITLAPLILVGAFLAATPATPPPIPLASPSVSPP